VRQLVVFQSRPVSSSPVYPAGCEGTPADPNIRPGEKEPSGARSEVWAQVQELTLRLKLNRLRLRLRLRRAALAPLAALT
jgi:hypothetical protein